MTTRPSRTRSRSPPLSRPTTPLRPSSRTSFRASTTATTHDAHNHKTTSTSSSHQPAQPLDVLEPQFAELADSMADLEANMMHLQLMHESLSRFGESFAAFLYGLNMNAFVVDFPEGPSKEGLGRWERRNNKKGGGEESLGGGGAGVGDETTTMMVGDASMASMRATPRRKSVLPVGEMTGTGNTGGSTRGPSGGRGLGASAGRGTRGIARGGRASGLPRGRGRSVK